MSACPVFVRHHNKATCLACDRAPWDGHERYVGGDGVRRPWRPGLVEGWVRNGLVDAARADVLLGRRGRASDLDGAVSVAMETGPFG